MQFVPFTDAHLTAASVLLAARHRASRQVEPLLPGRFEEPDTARVAVEIVWRKSGATGVAAMDGARLRGFLVGTPQIDVLRGRSVWVPFAGHAIDPEADAELYRDLYAALSPRWIAAGCFAHYAMIPATDAPALDAWFRLGFGMEQAHAVRETGGTFTPDPSLAIRRASVADLDRMLDVGEIVAAHQARSPVYGASLPEDRATPREDWTEVLTRKDWTVWLAERAGRVLGFQLYAAATPSDSDLMTPDGCIELKLGATRADERGSGAARLLTEHGLAWAAGEGYSTCIADWRVTNLLASRFWPRRGFRPVAHRLHRRIDERIIWANTRGEELAGMLNG